MKSLFIIAIAVVVALATTSANAQFSRVAYFTDSKCGSSPAIFDIYTASSTCTSTNATACTSYPSLNWYGFTTCSATVPSIGPKNTLLLNSYSDSTCSNSNLLVSQIFPLDTCVSVPGTGSMKSTGCKKLTIYSDSSCTTVKQSADFSSFNGVCNAASKYVCNDGRKIGGASFVVLIVGVLISLIF